MKYVKLNECYKGEYWYTKRPVLVIKDLKLMRYYRLEIEWASFNIKVPYKLTIIDEDCIKMTREAKLERILYA